MRHRWMIGTLAAASAWAQLGGGGGTAQPGSVAATVPLSGRNAQGGSATAVQNPVAGTTGSVNTLNTSIQIQGPYTGSTPGAERPFTGQLSLAEAVTRALAFNLGAAGAQHTVRQAEGAARVARSPLLPNVNAALSETVQQINLAASGLRISSPLPGFQIPSVAGPFNYFDLRASLSQKLFDRTARHNYLAARENARAAGLAVKDAAETVVFAAAGAYLQVQAGEARIAAVRAQIATAESLLKQAREQRAAGVLAQLDVNRAEVQLLTQQQRLETLENDLSKQKINLARLTGLPPNSGFAITDTVPYAPWSGGAELERQIADALAARPDVQAAEAQTRVASHARTAARSERLPTLSVSGNYGVIGLNPAQSHGTFAVVGTLSVPIWQGGRAEGSIQQAEAALAQRRAEAADLRGQIEAQVRSAYLDVETAARQVTVAGRNREVSRENLDLTRQKFDAGVASNVEVVQAQEALAVAELDAINSVFSHNVAKLSLGRALGRLASAWQSFLPVP